MNALMLALMPVFALLVCRTLCTLSAPPVPKYLEAEGAETMEKWWRRGA